MAPAVIPQHHHDELWNLVHAPSLQSTQACFVSIEQPQQRYGVSTVRLTWLGCFMLGELQQYGAARWLTKSPSQLAATNALVVASARPKPWCEMVMIGSPTLTESYATLPATTPDPYSIRKPSGSEPCSAQYVMPRGHQESMPCQQHAKSLCL